MTDAAAAQWAETFETLGVGGFRAFGEGSTAAAVPEDFGQPAAEYAALRRFVGVMPQPWRARLTLTGPDRLDFLQRLLTQDLRGLEPGHARAALLLDARGRITADLDVVHLDDSTALEVDACDAAAVRTALDRALFSEDVVIAEAAEPMTAVALIGPAGWPLVQRSMDADASAGGRRPPDRTPSASGYFAEGTHTAMTLHGVPCAVRNVGALGVPHYRVWVGDDDAPELFSRLLASAGYEAGVDEDALSEADAAAFAQRRRAGLRGRPAGWSAFNTLRVEQHRPMYHVDFGPDCLPAETGRLADTVSFTKGCYTGQEAVARMKALGHPKRLLVAVRFDGDAVPSAGLPLWDPAGDKVIGAITSSTASPLAGGRALAIAMVRWGRHEAGTKLEAPGPAGRIVGEVVPPASSP